MKKPARVLLIDDDPDICDVISFELNKAGYQADMTVSTAEEATLALGSQAFDVMICDVCLPGADGYDFLGFVRDKYPNIPVILFSGVESFQRKSSMSPDMYLNKPLMKEELLDALDVVLSLKSI